MTRIGIGCQMSVAPCVIGKRVDNAKRCRSQPHRRPNGVSRSRHAGDPRGPRGHSHRLIAASNVKIAYGTDCGTFPFPDGNLEFQAMVAGGINPARALRAATATAAEVDFVMRSGHLHRIPDHSWAAPQRLIRAI